MKHLGPERVEVPSSYNNLGIVYRNLGDFRQSKDNYARALDIYVKQLGPEHVHVATFYDNLGTVYRSLSYLQQAMESHARALDIV